MPAINSENDDLYEGNIDDSTTDDENDIVTDIPESVEYWTEKLPLHFESWIGCAAHQLQLVHDGYKELLSYRRVQVIFNKAKAICKLSHQSLIEEFLLVMILDGIRITDYISIF